jgi:hypothetical protein
MLAVAVLILVALTLQATMTSSGTREPACSQRGSLHPEMEKLDRMGGGAGVVLRNVERRQRSTDVLITTGELGEDRAG